MKDFLDVLQRIRFLEESGQPAVLATVLRVAGSTYRRPGARMVVEPDGTLTGVVSGGCLETDIVEHCRNILREGKTRILHYDTMSEDEAVWGLGSGCNGVIDVLLEPLPLQPDSFNYLHELQAAMEGTEPGYLWTVVEAAEGIPVQVGHHIWERPDGQLFSDIPDSSVVEVIRQFREIPENRQYANHRLEIQGVPVEVLVERILPPTRLHVFGAGKDAEPVVNFAALLGWRVFVYDHRPVYARAERFPGAQKVQKIDYGTFLQANPIHPNDVVLIMTHLYLHDKTLLEYLVQHPPRYLGVLGPRRRTKQLLEELQRGGTPMHPDLKSRLFSPIGLDIGAETPEEIALSILSEIIAMDRHRAGGPLRNRKGPIHS